MKTIFLITFTFIAQLGFGQTSDVFSIEKQLCSLHDKIAYWSENRETDIDSLEFYNEAFSHALLYALNNNPATLDYEFTQLHKKIQITASADKKLRAYSWNTQMGGTMHDLQTVFQYKGKSAVKASLLTSPIGDGEIYWCAEIFSFTTKTKTVYIASTFATESSKYYYNSVKCLTIEGDSLNSTIALIKTKEGLQNSIGVEYLNYYGEERTDIPEKLIDFNPEKSILKIIKTNDSQNIINAFDQYKFNGSYFKKQN